MPFLMLLSRRLTPALLMLLATLALPAFADDATPGGTGAPAGLVIQAGDAAPLTLTRDRLAALPQTTQRVTQRTGRGEATTEWTGPLLWTVLTSTGLVDADKHGDHPRLVLRISGRDGYAVTVALAELAPGYEGKPVLVALSRDGTDLAEGALRLVVPGDGRAGRSVRDLARIAVSH